MSYPLLVSSLGSELSLLRLAGGEDSEVNSLSLFLLTYLSSCDFLNIKIKSLGHFLITSEI